jgi:hypothetical protein
VGCRRIYIKNPITGYSFKPSVLPGVIYKKSVIYISSIILEESSQKVESYIMPSRIYCHKDGTDIDKEKIVKFCGNKLFSMPFKVIFNSRCEDIGP